MVAQVEQKRTLQEPHNTTDKGLESTQMTVGLESAKTAMSRESTETSRFESAEKAAE